MFAVGVDYLYSAPYAGIYRGMGIVAANGVSTLPHNCLLIACLMASRRRPHEPHPGELRYRIEVIKQLCFEQGTHGVMGHNMGLRKCAL